MLGLGMFSIAVMALSLYLGVSGYSVATFLVALAALGLALVALVIWASSRWARRAVERARSLGNAAWIVQVEESDGGPSGRIAVLEADRCGLSVAIKLGVVQANWADLTMIGIAARGLLRRQVVVVEGTLWGRVEFEVLQLNAVARADDNSLQECVATLKNLELESRGR